MAITVISTDRTARIFSAATGDDVVVTASGSIINADATIDAPDVTGQFITNAGLIEVSYIWLGGDATTTAIVSQTCEPCSGQKR